MVRRSADAPETSPMKSRLPRAPLPARGSTEPDDPSGMTHEQLVQALRAIEGLVDVGSDAPNFHLRSRPFLHFHQHDQGMSADVRFGSGDFEAVWVSTPSERQELLARVCDHVEQLRGTRKTKKRGRPPKRSP
jgi:hypothetical protein